MVVTNGSGGWHGRKGAALLGGQWELVSFITTAYEWVSISCVCIYEWGHILLKVFCILGS